MPMDTATSLSILDRYRAKTPKSAALYERAKPAFPSGLTHDSRVLDPYPLFAERAAGPRKWCVDGHEYVDYFGGHGALLLGHCAPEVVAAVQRQVTIGTHFGSCARARAALGGARQIAGAGRGARALHRLGYRSDAPGIALGPRLYRQGQGGTFPRPLSRLARPCCGRQQLALRRHAADRRIARHRSIDHSDADGRRANDRLAVGKLETTSRRSSSSRRAVRGDKSRCRPASCRRCAK